MSEEGGGTDLTRLLGTMRPRLDEQAYVFCVTEAAALERLQARPRGIFAEEEGLTVILTPAAAEAAGLAHGGPFALITLTVHSSLAAVGFLAEVAARLAAAGISANVVSAFYHDHLFVPWARRFDALAALRELSAAAGERD